LKTSNIILKQNPLIKAKFNWIYKESHHDIINGLVHIFQNSLLINRENVNLFNYDLLEYKKVHISADKLRSICKFGKRENDYMFDILKSIRDQSATLINFKDEDGVFYKKKTLSFLDSVGIIKNDTDKRKDDFEIVFSSDFIKIATKAFNLKIGNFTQVPLSNVTTLNSKHAKRLYEMILSHLEYKEQWTLNKDQLDILFDMENKPLSYIVRTIQRNYNHVYKLIHFSYEVHKKDKLISFYFDKDITY